MGLVGRRNSDVWERARDRFYNIDQAGSSSSRPSRPQPTPLKWVKGGTQNDETRNPATSRDAEDDEEIEVVDDDVSVENTKEDGGRDLNAGPSGEKGDAVEEIQEGQSSTVSDDGKRTNTAEEEVMEEDPSGAKSPSDNSKTEPSAENSVQKANDKDDVSSEAASKLDSSGNQESSSDQSRLKSKAKTGAQASLNADAQQSSSGKQGTTEAPKEREAAKKPIKFVIPPRMNTRSDGSKNPLTASSSRHDPSGNSGDGPTGRKTRQSSRRSKDKGDNIDMFENGWRTSVERSSVEYV